MAQLTPQEIVDELDHYIIGQNEAKKSVAIALRNRYRRKNIKSDLQDEIIPKNILMIGPTGVGKTEIARRLAGIADSPFLKVEVTKFTEAGYVGRDVDSMVRDLVKSAMRMLKEKKINEVQDQAYKMAEDRILESILPSREKKSKNPLNFLFDRDEDYNEEEKTYQESLQKRREDLRQRLREGELDDRMIEIEVKSKPPQMMELFSGTGVEEMGIDFQDMFGSMFPDKKKKKKVTIEEAREIFKEEEAEKLIDEDEIGRQAVTQVEENGIIFLDELDKIAGRESGTSGPEVSREGVQRDILPIVEGSTVTTKHGSVKTDHILFIAAGAFHVSKPSDLIPELQGRFPLRVELHSLTKENFVDILKLPKNALTKQYKALLGTEGIDIDFTPGAIEEIAGYAFQVNEVTENIGARRLHTIMEHLLEELSFNAPGMDQGSFTIDVDYVREQLEDVVQDEDLSRYIL